MKTSIMYKNLSVISRETGINISCLVNNTAKMSHIKKLLKSRDNYENSWKINLIKELIDIKDDCLNSLFNTHEVVFTLNFLCTQ